jgi:hypothetical protein
MVNEQELKQMHDKIAELEESVVHQRARADRAETFICTMCSECDYEVNDGILIMQKRCCSLFPLDCGKFKLRSLWIPVTERLPSLHDDVLMYFKDDDNMAVGYLDDVDEDTTMWSAYSDGGYYTDCDYVPTHWMPLPSTEGLE